MGTNEQDLENNMTLAELFAAPLLAANQSNQQLATASLDWLQQAWLEPASASNPAGAGAPAPTQARMLQIDIGSMPGGEERLAFAVKVPVATLLQPTQLAVQMLEVDFSVEVRNVARSAAGEGVGQGVLGILAPGSRQMRQSDQSGKYQMRMHASQVAPAPGMSRLMQLLTAVIEPLPLPPDQDS